jgi:hypothetical protein
LLLYQVISKQPEKILLTVTEVKGKLDRVQVYKREALSINDGEHPNCVMSINA